MTGRAVLLVAGRGTRLQREDPAVPLDPAQAEAARRGLKALVPIHGHPYLAYVLHELAEAGYREAVLVVRPGDDPVARAARDLRPRRLRLAFAAQEHPRGTADAVLAAEASLGDDPFTVINGDNVYPAAALAALASLPGPGLVGFTARALVERSNIPAERLGAFALVSERAGWLEGLAEKPGARAVADADDPCLSMTCWRFTPAIFDDCRATQPSPRGELELTDAVARAVSRGERFRVIRMAEGVLDLSERADIPALERWLDRREPAP
jgi:glucose-1-phosphate thymidylyltransferase